MDKGCGANAFSPGPNGKILRPCRKTVGIFYLTTLAPQVSIALFPIKMENRGLRARARALIIKLSKNFNHKYITIDARMGGTW